MEELLEEDESGGPADDDVRRDVEDEEAAEGAQPADHLPEGGLVGGVEGGGHLGLLVGAHGGEGHQRPPDGVQEGPGREVRAARAHQ